MSSTLTTSPPLELSMDPNNLVWNETEYKLKFILDNPNFELPQIVRVHQGHMVDEDDSLASGQILTIHGKKKIDNINGHDMYDREVNIPITCPYKVRLVALVDPRKFCSVYELCFCEDKPKFIKLENDVVDGADVTIKTKDILQIKDNVLDDNGEVIGLNCQIDDENDNEGRTITLPINFSGGFKETLAYEQLQKRLSVTDLLNDYKLPIKVQFLPNSEKNSAYGPHLGVITLVKKISINSVLATTIIDNVRHALTFSADLPVTIQVATGIKKNSYGYPSRGHSEVDLKRFDYCSPSNPYSGVTLQMFDDLRTPMIPRRSRQNRTKTISDFNSSRYNSTATIPDIPKKTQSTTTLGVKRNKSFDFGKNSENSFFSKFGLKSLRKSVSGKLSRDKNKKLSSEATDLEFDEQASFIASDDGNSTVDNCSYSNGSDRTGSDPFNRLADCMDTMSLDTQSISTPHRRRLSRKDSGDSGICLSGRKHTPRSRSRSRSRSRMSPDGPSSNPSDTIDSYSEWSLPIHVKDSPSSGRKTYSSQGGSSSSYLWGTDTGNSSDAQTEKSSNTENYKSEFVNSQNAINIMNYHNNENEKENITTCKELSPLTSKQLASMDEIRQLNEDGVCRILETLKFHEFQDSFIQNQINGELLLELELTDLVNDLKLSLFQAKKIVKYIKGWRPQSEHFLTTEASRRNSLNPRDWSENDVFLHMTTINLSEFGQFCIKNQVNGDLLLDILDKETLNSVKNDHHVKISNLESKKLLNFVVKGWRPDISPKKSAIM